MVQGTKNPAAQSFNKATQRYNFESGDLVTIVYKVTYETSPKFMMELVSIQATP